MNKKTETQVSDGQSDEYLVNLGQRIKDVREGKGMNVVNICFVTDLAVGTISNIERGKNVSYVTLHKILLALKSPPDEILPPDDHDILPIEVTISEDETQKYLDLVNAFQKTSEPLSHLIRKLHLASEHDIADGKEATAAEADPREPVVRQLGERIRDIRLARQMSVSELGAASGHQTPAMQLIEIGLRKPSIESLRRIAAALKVALPQDPLHRPRLRSPRQQGSVAHHWAGTQEGRPERRRPPRRCRKCVHSGHENAQADCGVRERDWEPENSAGFPCAVFDRLMTCLSPG